MKTNKTLGVFLFLHFIIWSVLPIVLRPNLPMDTSEALVWGFINEWGTNKHPPVSGFFANLIYELTSHPSSLYILSQLFIIGGFIYIYKTARLFLPEKKSLIATLILEGVAYYNMVTPEYNVNIVALMLWPAATYYFYLSVNKNKLSDWLLFGLFCGLNILNKYVSGILLICFACYLLFSKQGRACFKSWKFYVGGLTAFAVILPHLIWLHNRDYFVIEYFLGRSQGGKSLPYGLAHIVYPLKFIGSQILTSLFALITLIVAYKFSPKETTQTNKSDNKFLFFTGVLPVLIMALISLILGIKLKSMWGSPVMYLLGVCFFVYFPFDIKKTYNTLVKASYFALFAFALAFVAQVLFTTSAKFKINASDFTTAVKGENYEYVGGSVWLASTVGVYAHNHPKVLFLMSPKDNPWIDMADVTKKGILVVTEDLWEYENYQKTFANLSKPKVYLLKAKNILGKERQHKLYYGSIKGDKR